MYFLGSSTCLLLLRFQLAVEYESNAIIVKVDTDDEYEFARDMQVIVLCRSSFFTTHKDAASLHSDCFIMDLSLSFPENSFHNL